jgi:hypothetical protein
MAIDIDKSVATKLLHESYKACSNMPIVNCSIKDTIDFVMNGKNCLTYRYIMFTALLAKAVDSKIDILSLQAGDTSIGAYDARSLASKVVYSFQKNILGNVLDGANSDPLVNKPGRFLRLDKSNAAAGGDPTKALELLCDNLPKVQDNLEARQCIDYIVSMLLDAKAARDLQQSLIQENSRNMSVFRVREFMSELLDKGFGGAALVIVTTALYHLQYSDDEYRISAHPVNQSGSSQRQFSDLDVFRDDLPFIATELKDKPFSSSDVDHAAETAYKAHAQSLMFVAGRQSSFASQPPTYFDNARKKYADKGMYVGVTSIDNLIDTVLSAHIDLNAVHIIDIIAKTAESIGALEAQMWVYERMSNKK